MWWLTQGDPPPPPEQIGPWHFPAEAAPFFQEVASLRYPFDVVYNNSRDYLDILATQSGTRALGRARSEDFLGRVRDRLHSLGSPQLDRHLRRLPDHRTADTKPGRGIR